MAGNQLGKTVAGGAEMAMHLTGRYPDWWEGRRWDGPVNAWASGVTGESTRDNPQRILMGRPGDYGTGSIPQDCIIDTTAARGVADSLDGVTIKHASGGVSRLAFKSYEKGREKWQGETLDLIWFDEEPPLDIYSEGLTRIQARSGMVYTTFTPLKGMSEVVTRFMIEENDDRIITSMTIDDAEHYTEEERSTIIAGYPPHEREARAKGVPIMGSGRVFPIEERAIMVEAFTVPSHWPQLVGMDFGIDHPTAAVRLAWDRDADCVYVIATYRKSDTTPMQHALTLANWGAWLPFSWPHDGWQRVPGDGKSSEHLKDMFAKHGLNMRPEHAQFKTGGYGTEAGIADILERMETGRFKVFAHLADWWEEFRIYHRDNGIIVKKRDDLMSATRIGVMDLRYAATEPTQIRAQQFPELDIV